MRLKFYALTPLLTLTSFLATLCIGNAQGIPFNCDYSAYLFQYNDVYAIDLASGNSFLAATDITSGNINATAYNPADGYIWGYLSSPSKSIVRIGKNFETTTYTIDSLPSGTKYVGDISLEGQYYFKAGGSAYYIVDLDPTSATYKELTTSASLSQNISIHDWAFNAVDGHLYALEKNTNILYRINPSNGDVFSLGEVPILSGLNYTYGAVYFDDMGRFYVSANQTGTIYVIQNVQDLNGSNAVASNLFAFGPSSASNDGARCPTAPVAQEICDNGIDDDGDGLIDCEDPSCSGYGSCATINPQASSGNKGGLESNNRLSDVIAKRNYSRSKINYSFERDLAPLVEKGSNYGTRNTSTTLALQDFIPLNEINEDYSVASTPEDLIGITNATEVYAVDYIKDELSKASILALKTENGVYEHTKYICDRLLGAQLISVSTIEINGQPFIKSLIKNIDGSVEFVLSLSAKVVHDEAEFAVESHWNLNTYEQDVTFYNFQIWATYIDDLYTLGQEVLNLLEVQKPITSYDTSSPPTVFVRRGNYRNGELDLQIVNTNMTQSINLDAGIRATETSVLETMSTTIDLGGDYIIDVTIPTGPLFDIGFRIGDGIATPDDLFLSDGPWGLDLQETTTVQEYEITENENTFDSTTFLVERNLHLSASTSTYVAAYRALTARFQAVDVSTYNTLQLTARGTGDLQITFVRKSIANWEDQFKTTIALTEDAQDFDLSFDHFISASNEALVLDDLATIVFTMLSENGTVQSKEMHLEDIRFTTTEVLSTENPKTSEVSALINYPNPFTAATTIKLATASTTVQITVVDMLGRVVDRQQLITQQGGRTATYTAPSLTAGIYTYQLIDAASQPHSGKFMIQ